MLGQEPSEGLIAEEGVMRFFSGVMHRWAARALSAVCNVADLAPSQGRLPCMSGQAGLGTSTAGHVRCFPTPEHRPTRKKQHIQWLSLLP